MHSEDERAEYSVKFDETYVRISKSVNDTIQMLQTQLVVTLSCYK